MFFTSETIEHLKIDHSNIRVQMAILLDKDKSFHEKKEAFAQMVPILRSHAEREERVIYEYMKTVDHELKEMALAGETEHRLIDELVQKLLGESLSLDAWMAQVKVLADLLKMHLDQEEHDAFPKIKKHLDREQDELLSHQYVSPRDGFPAGHSFA